MNGLGTRIRELRIERGVRQADLADRLNISRSAIAMWELGHREPPLDTLVRIAEALQAPLSALLPTASAGSTLTPVETRRIPLLSTSEPAPETAPRIDISEPGCDFAMSIDDDSMSPTLLPGDTVFLHKAVAANDGQIVALLHDGKLCLRRAYRTGETYTLLCDNPGCAPISQTEPHIIGRAIAYRRRLRP